jgi:flagellar biosynthesis chaperone FliJ
MKPKDTTKTIDRQIARLVRKQQAIEDRLNLRPIQAMTHPDIRNLQAQINALLLQRDLL